MKHGFILAAVQIVNMNFSLDHRYAGSLKSAVHIENRSGDGNPAVLGGDIEASAARLGGLYADAAALEVNGQVPQACRYGNSGSLAQLHHGAITEAYDCTRVAGRSDLGAAGQVFAAAYAFESLAANAIKFAL